MHRRTNSYSYTVSTGSSNHLVPPPASLLSKRLGNVQHSEAFVRSTLDRRSYKTTSSLSANKGYRTVAVSPAVPAAIRFSVEDNLEMSNRPRSPLKAPKGGAKQTEVFIPELDSALADIKEQMLLLKRERNDITDRLDSLMAGIHDTYEELRARTIQAQRSPAQALRRIHSLEGGSSSQHGSSTSSHNRLASIDSIDAPILEMSDCSSTSSVENSPASSATRLHRRGSMPNATLRSVNAADQKSYSPNIVRRNSSLSKKGSPRGLATIHDSSVLSMDDDDEEDSSSDESSTQCQVVPISPQSNNIKVLVSPKNSKTGWTSKSSSAANSYYYTLPHKRSSTPTSPLHSIQFNRSEFGSFSDSMWDKTSVHSADSSSMVLQISSATGQLEKVPKPSKTKLFVSKKGGSTEHIYQRQQQQQPMSSSLPNSSRFSVSSYFIGPGFEDTDGMIMKLSEEPAPSRSTSISSISSRSSSFSSQHYVKTSSRSGSTSSNSKRHSLVLNSRETTV